MTEKNYIQIFEYDTLRVGEGGFTTKQFDQLVLFNDRQRLDFFRVGHLCLTFREYVGVIQVGRLTIEVLPKADNNPDPNRWQRALLDMLRVCGHLKLHAHESANLALRRTSLLDLYTELFIREVESLIHRGLVRQYRFREGNTMALKGALQFGRHIQENLAHRERFYTRHQVYDGDHLLHQILKCALRILDGMLKDVRLQSRTRACLLQLEGVGDRTIRASDFQRVHLDRKTTDYRTALDLARLIILHYAPDLSRGHQDVLAILFNMNDLFERFVLRLLQRAAGSPELPPIRVQGQASKAFWQNQTLRPDILLTLHPGTLQAERIIIDTKWKKLDARSPRPSMSDLRQMYAYNLYFGASRGVLLYPNCGQGPTAPVPFKPGELVEEEHSVQLVFAELFDATGRLRKGVGEELVAELVHATLITEKSMVKKL